VHYCPESHYGPYWSVTKYKDIMQVEVNHQVYLSWTPKTRQLVKVGPAPRSADGAGLGATEDQLHAMYLIVEGLIGFGMIR
jgi:hypothetical protein